MIKDGCFCKYTFMANGSSCINSDNRGYNCDCHHENNQQRKQGEI